MEQTLNEIKDEKDNSEKENIEEIISKNTSKDDIENKILLDSPKREEKMELEEKEKLKNDLLKDIQNNSDNKNSNKSTSIEKQDISEDNIEPLTSNNKFKINNSTTIKNKKVRQKNKNQKIKDFSEYYNKMKDYEKKKAEKIKELKKELENKEIKDLKEKPEISQKSKEIINNKNKKENLFERMKEKERIANEKKIKLKEKINLERAKKKEEEDKPLEFKTHLKPNNQKFNKVYYEMKRKNDKKKEDFKIFAEVVRQYEIRECKFQPNLNDEDIEEGETKIKHRKLNSCELIQRLYDNEIKNRIKKKEDLEQKYKPTFKPKINDISIEISNRRKLKLKSRIDEKSNINDKSSINAYTKRQNNSALKRKTKKFDIVLKKREKSVNNRNITDINIEKKNEENNIIVSLNSDIIDDNNNDKNNDKINLKEEIKEQDNNQKKEI